MPHQPYNYQGLWNSKAIYNQFDSVRANGIKYYWANPKAGNSAPPSADWEEI